MKSFKLIAIIITVIGCLSACAQNHQQHSHRKIIMDTSKIKDIKVKKAIDAFQTSDINTWNSLFSEDAILLDDGNPRDLKEFSMKAIKIENFVTIDKIEDNGNSVFGQFHSDKWGDFKAYFKFHFNEYDKIKMLEIGQANY